MEMLVVKMGVLQLPIRGSSNFSDGGVGPKCGGIGGLHGGEDDVQCGLVLVTTLVGHGVACASSDLHGEGHGYARQR
jgi:hypothetical protein